MLAPSMPEQPTPLTRQERLLLRVAATGKAVTLAQDSLSAHEAREEHDEQIQQQSAALGAELARGLKPVSSSTQVSE
jgi:hypothetical protein